MTANQLIQPKNLEALIADITIQAIMSENLKKGLYSIEGEKLSKWQAQDIFDAHNKVRVVGFNVLQFLVGIIEVETFIEVCFNKTTKWYACKFLTASNIEYWKVVRIETTQHGHLICSMFMGKLND